MKDVSEQKKELRNRLLEKRKEISNAEWQKRCERIESIVLEMNEVRDASRIHCYISMNQRKEVNTHSLVARLIEKGKQVFIPVTNFENNTLEHTEILDLGELKENKWGVLEPDSWEVVEPDIFDLILVPLLAVDNHGNRLGYGKGFYDRFLSSTKAKRFGLVMNDFILDEIPTEEFDEKLDGFISENGVRYL